MKEYAKQPENISRVIQNQAKASPQVSLTQILQREAAGPYQRQTAHAAFTPVLQLLFDGNNPATWIRPNWDERKKERLWEKQTELNQIPVSYTDPVSREEITVMQTLCPYCHELMTYQGCAIDHIEDWKSYAINQYGMPMTLENLKQAYNDEDNLVLTCSSCNSAKQAINVEDYLSLRQDPARRGTWGRPNPLKEKADEVKACIADINMKDYFDESYKSTKAGELRRLLVRYSQTGDEAPIAEAFQEINGDMLSEERWIYLQQEAKERGMDVETLIEEQEEERERIRSERMGWDF